MYFILFFFSLVSVAFFTLLERRILGSFHNRQGPFIVGFIGILQPLGDALKLFTKREDLLRYVNIFYWIISPILFLLFYFILLFFFPLGGIEYFIKNFYLIFVCFLSARVYFFIFGGFYSGRKYSFLGSYRCISQIMSYEILLIFLFVCFFLLVEGWNLVKKIYFFNNFRILFVFPFIFIWIFVFLAERNRLPYDFLEGESELVSGFNTEYWGGYFSFLFIYEYGIILFFRILTSYFLFRGFFSFLFFFLIIFFFLWIRRTVPRFRYDFLINLAWKKFLFIIVRILIFFVFL